MIFGVGTDILDTLRIKKLIENKDFIKRIFTEKEIEICKKSKNHIQKYAVRFSAKESFMKALGTGWAKGVKFNEIEILNQADGKPFVVLHGNTKEIINNLEIKNIHISMSHIKEVVNSIVILEK